MGSDDYEEMEDDPTEVKPHCLGHRFHYCEIVFILLTIFGVLTFVDTLTGFIGIDYTDDTFMLAMGIIYVVACAFATSLVWNLVSIKRVAACAEMMKKEVEKLKYENERARNMQEEKKRQDEQMKTQLAELEKAQLLLKGSVDGLEGVKSQQEDMMAEREEMLEARRELAEKLTKDMFDLWEATIEHAREELTDRAEMYFKAADREKDGIEVGGTEWQMLEDLMQVNGVTLNSTAAGEDGVMDHEEFSQWLDNTMRYHFEELAVSVRECERIREEMTNIKIDAMSKK